MSLPVQDTNGCWRLKVSAICISRIGAGNESSRHWWAGSVLRILTTTTTLINPGTEAHSPWETGTGPNALIHGLKASLELITGIGTDRIAQLS